jgi:hypothetical protein
MHCKHRARQGPRRENISYLVDLIGKQERYGAETGKTCNRKYYSSG